jgi:hypothetical protein
LLTEDKFLKSGSRRQIKKIKKNKEREDWAGRGREKEEEQED